MVKTLYKIFCDRCGEAYKDDHSKTGTNQRRGYGDSGWNYSAGKDYCPLCSPIVNIKFHHGEGRVWRKK